MAGNDNGPNPADPSTGRNDLFGMQGEGGGGGGQDTFFGGAHTVDDTPVTSGFLTLADPNMPRGTIVFRGMVSANREDELETGGFVFDGALYNRDGAAPLILGVPTVTKYTGAITPGITFTLVIDGEGNLAGVFTGVDGTEMDWTVSGTWVGNFGGGGDGGGK